MIRAAITGVGMWSLSMRRRLTKLAIMPMMGIRASHWMARRMRAYWSLKEPIMLMEDSKC